MAAAHVAVGAQRSWKTPLAHPVSKFAAVGHLQTCAFLLEVAAACHACIVLLSRSVHALHLKNSCLYRQRSKPCGQTGIPLLSMPSAGFQGC